MAVREDPVLDRAAAAEVAAVTWAAADPVEVTAAMLWAPPLPQMKSQLEAVLWVPPNAA